MIYSDSERLDFLIRNSQTWSPVQTRQDGTIYDGCWDDGSPNYGVGGDPITPEGFEDPRAAIDAALDEEQK